MEKKEFLSKARKKLWESLKPLNFVVQGNSWLRIRSPYIECIDIQTSSDKSSCAVNLGLHLDFLPPVSGLNNLNTPNIKTVDCEIRKRSCYEGESDHWWSFSEGDSGISELSTCTLSDIDNFFGRFETFPGPFDHVRIENIDEENINQIFPYITKARLILMIARVNQYLNNKDGAIAWSKFGIGHARGVQTRCEFRSIIKSMDI